MNIWIIAAIALLAGFVPGLLLFPWLASPLGPGLWKLSTPFTRIFLTVSQFIRKRGVLVKVKEGYYEIGTYDDDESHVILSDRTVPVNSDELRWGLFGKRPFGITWQSGTELHERIATGEELSADGGGYSVDMGALHRYLRGANDADAITRTEEKAKAEHGLGKEQLSDLVMGVLIGVMLLLGSLTTYIML